MYTTNGIAKKKKKKTQLNLISCYWISSTMCKESPLCKPSLPCGIPNLSHWHPRAHMYSPHKDNPEQKSMEYSFIHKTYFFSSISCCFLFLLNSHCRYSGLPREVTKHQLHFSSLFDSFPLLSDPLFSSGLCVRKEDSILSLLVLRPK